MAALVDLTASGAVTWGAHVAATRGGKITGQAAGPLEAAAREAVAATAAASARASRGSDTSGGGVVADTMAASYRSGSSSMRSTLRHSVRDSGLGGVSVEEARAANVARARALLHANRVDPVTHRLLVPTDTAVWAGTLTARSAAVAAAAGAAAAEVSASERGTRTGGASSLRRTGHGLLTLGPPRPMELPPFACGDTAGDTTGVAVPRPTFKAALPASYPRPGTEGSRVLPPAATTEEVAASRWDAAGRWWRARNYNSLLARYYDPAKEVAEAVGEDASSVTARRLASSSLPPAGLRSSLYNPITGAPTLRPGAALTSGWDPCATAASGADTSRYDAVVDERALTRRARRGARDWNPVLGVPPEAAATAQWGVMRPDEARLPPPRSPRAHERIAADAAAAAAVAAATSAAATGGYSY